LHCVCKFEDGLCSDCWSTEKGSSSFFHRKPAGPFQVGSDVRTEAERIISTFYFTLDQTTKTIIHNDMLAGRTRILVSSEAYGLGMDVDDVRVVQWRVAKVDSMDTVVQRFGRAGRDFNKQAMAVLYVELAKHERLDSTDGGMGWQNVRRRWR
jgi:superfamily II DNA helicase RecQ